MKSEKYFTIDELEAFKFFQIPKSLMNKKYDGLRFEAKFLYGLLFERTKLSREKGWFDEKGRAFIYFERIEVADMLKIGEKKASVLFKELVKFNLIVEISEGKGTKNRIYVLKSAIKENFEKREYRKSKDKRKEQREKKVQNNDDCQNGSHATAKMDVSQPPKWLHSNKEVSNKEYSNNNNREMEKLGNSKNNKKDVVVVKEEDKLNFINECTDKNIKELQKKWIDTLEVHLKQGISKNTLIVQTKVMKELIETQGIEKINHYLDNHNCFTYKQNATGLMLEAIRNNYQITEVKAPEYKTNSGQPLQATNFEQRTYSDEFFEGLYDNF